jgi:hypothetical protein
MPKPFLFIVATAPLLTHLKYKYLMVVLSIVAMGIVFSGFSFILDFAPSRLDADSDLISLKITAISVFIANAAIIATAYFASIGSFKQPFDQEIAKVSGLLYIGGFLFFFIAIAFSHLLAWRMYEMLTAFGVFIIIAALRSAPNKILIVAGLSYFALNLVVLARSDLFVKYSINSSVGAMYGIFQ